MSSCTDSRLSAGGSEGGRTALDNKTSSLNTPSQRSFSGPWTREYNPYNYSDSIGVYEKETPDTPELRDGKITRQTGGPTFTTKHNTISLFPFQAVTAAVKTKPRMLEAFLQV